MRALPMRLQPSTLVIRIAHQNQRPLRLLAARRSRLVITSTSCGRSIPQSTQRRHSSSCSPRSSAHDRIQTHAPAPQRPSSPPISCSAATTSSLGPFRHTPVLRKQMPQRPKPPPDDEFEENFLKGSGPGGQKINKTSSAVQLLHKPTGIVVKSQATRSRSQNRTIARQLLADKLDALANGDQSRAAIVGSHKAKKKASSAKKSRRKYRKLAEEGQEAEEGKGHGQEADAVHDAVASTASSSARPTTALDTAGRSDLAGRGQVSSDAPMKTGEPAGS